MNDMRRKPDQEYSKALEVQEMHTPETSYQKLATGNEREARYERIRWWSWLCVPILIGAGSAMLTVAVMTLMNESTNKEVRAQLVLTNDAQVEAKIASIMDDIEIARQKELIEIREAMNELGKEQEATAELVDENRQLINAFGDLTTKEMRLLKKQVLEMEKDQGEVYSGLMVTLKAYEGSKQARSNSNKIINEIDREKADF